MTATVTRRGLLDMQVCVPKDWTNAQVLDFAEKANPCGTENGWFIRLEGSKRLSGMPERMQCAELHDHCHIMLEA